MRRPFLIVLLSIGAVGGFASGFHSLRHRGAAGHGCGWQSRYEQRLDAECARRASATAARTTAPPPPAASSPTVE